MDDLPVPPNTTPEPTTTTDELVSQGQEALERVFSPPTAAAVPKAVGGRRRLTSCSVVVPAFNEQDNIAPLHARLVDVLDRHAPDYEIIFVDDGSTDETLERIRALARQDDHVHYVSFARNFGHETATTAGLDRARGEVVVLMDADLQDPPELLPELIDRWEAGFDMVCAKRRSRDGESLFKRTTAWTFYRLLDALAPMKVPLDTGDFRLMDHRIVAAFRRMPEANRFVRGMIAWIGHRQTTVEFDRPARHAGECKYNLTKLAALSIDALVSFSTRPLRIASILGGLVMLGSVITAAVLGTPFLLGAGLFFLGGVQMLLIGILGEYVGRIHTQVQSRPLYTVQEER